MLNLNTLIVMASAFVVALLAVLPETSGVFPFYIAASGLHIADTMAHEMGHAIFAWLFGQPSIPMLFTIFGADQAGGMALTFDRSWLLQILIFAALFYGCYAAWNKDSPLLIPMVCFSLLVLALAFLRHPELVSLYMGHGTAIFVGGFLLFRAWVYVDWRSKLEHFLNALFGFFMVLSNAYFSYGLAYDEDLRAVYSEHNAFGIMHNDFAAMADLALGWSVKGIAQITIGYCVVVMLAAFALAWFFQDDFAFDDGDK